MKKILITLLGMIQCYAAWPCTVCKKAQPEILQGFTHGAGPDSDWDYLILAVMVAVVIGTFLLTVNSLIRPETSKDHIKKSILTANEYER